MSVGIGTEATQFLFWEYLFRIFVLIYETLQLSPYTTYCTVYIYLGPGGEGSLVN
jgi:hypothetical protein